MKQISLLAALLTAAVITSCASHERAPIDANANLKTEIDLIEAKLQAASYKQYDHLAPKNFETAKKYRSSAKQKLDEGKPSEKVREDIAVAKHAIQKVESIGAAQGPGVKSILAARQNAINTQAPKFQEKRFNSAESDLEDMAEDMENEKFKVDAEDITELQNKYITAMIESRKIIMLKNARETIEHAENDGAKSKTPQTLEAAKAAVTSAERAIEISPNASSGYTPAVNQANLAALKLKQVLELAKENNASEQAALGLWTRNEQLQAASAALVKANADAAAERTRMEEASASELATMEASAAAEKLRLESELARNASKLETQGATVAALRSQNKQYANEEELKMKIEELRKTFSPDEAEVLKQGNNVVVRLKKMQFSVNRTELKPDSYATLKKVEDLIAAVPAKQITVEGHTDSSGGAKMNQALSEKRAESVKKYLESQKAAEDISINATGYGSNRPLTSNKTKAGRATNRRVDIVIETPVVL